jgi:arylsulfatase A-like enzyme
MTVPRLALAILAAGILAAAWRSAEGRWLLSFLTHTKSSAPAPFLGPAEKCRGCNLLLISLDTLRADRVAHMPRLREIAAQSMHFTQAYTNAYFTTPSHMTAFTSLYPATHHVESSSIRLESLEGDEDLKLFSGANSVPLAQEHTTLAEVLAKSGYKTHWQAPLRLKFFDPLDGFHRGFQTIRGPAFARALPQFQGDSSGFDLHSLQPLGRGPSFIFSHSYITHVPYPARENVGAFDGLMVPYGKDLLEKFRRRLAELPELLVLQSKNTMPAPEEIKKIVAACTRLEDLRECFQQRSSPDAFWHAAGQFQGGRAKVVIVSVGAADTDRELAMYRRAYDQAVAELDRQIGMMWDELRRSGALQNTVVAFFADHGEQLFEHGEMGHADFFQATARIPLIIYHPKMKGVAAGQLATLVDLMPMLLEILDLKAPAQTQGRVLWNSPREWAYGSTLGSDYITDGRWKLLRDYLGHERLYHLESDPLEQVDAAQFRNPWSRAAYKRLSAARDKFQLEQSL